MPRTETIERTVYQFSELSDRAKEKARDWYREASQHDDWWDSTYDDFTTIAEMLGVTINTHAVKLMNGKTRQEPTIYFSLDRYYHVDYSGSWSWPKDPLDQVTAYTNDEELIRIASAITTARAQFVMRYGADADEISGSIDKAKCTLLTDELTMAITDANGDSPELPLAAIEALEEAISDLGPWLLKQLAGEWDYINSDECIDENIEANEYEFDEDGDRI